MLRTAVISAASTDAQARCRPRCGLYGALLLAGTLGAPAATYAQVPGTHVGMKAGLNLATLSGTLNSEPSSFAGFTLGPTVRFAPSRQGFAVQSELQLSLQGANLKKRDAAGQTYTARRRISYLNVPVLLRQYIGRKLYVNVGPQVGILLGASNSGSAAIQKLEAAGVGGVGVEFASGLFLDARYVYGLTDITRNADERYFRRQLNLGGLYNRVGQFSLGYIIGAR